MLITKEEKLEIVLRHLRDGLTLRELAEEYDMHPSSIKYYVNLYLDHGADVFTNEDGPKTYSREYKLAAIKRYIEGNESIRSIAVDLGLTDYSVLRDWIQKYKAGGEDAIQTSHSRKNYLMHEDRQNAVASRELKERLNHLEAENEYLKKLYSLILERSRPSRKKSKSSAN